MSALILFGVAIPLALTLSVWSDVRSIEETKQAKSGREPFEYAGRLSHGSQGGLKMLADKIARQWAGIERAMKFANHNPAFRPKSNITRLSAPGASNP